VGASRDAEARERLAQAEAKATEMVSAAIAQGDVTAINYFVADKYMKVLAELADSPNQKVLIMPMEVTGVLGSLAGIAEIARATFGDGATRTAPSTPSVPARRPSVPPVAT
jgi:regulator of protease activity HflC (stomatin/prohibitin superfamily)